MTYLSLALPHGLYSAAALRDESLHGLCCDVFLGCSKGFFCKTPGMCNVTFNTFPHSQKEKTTRRTYILLDRSIDMTVHLSSGLVRCDAAPVGRSCRWIAHPS